MSNNKHLEGLPDGQSSGQVTQLPVLLDTGLFNDRETLLAAVERLNLPESHRRTLNPTTMNDGDWDDVLDLVLSAKRVITL